MLMIELYHQATSAMAADVMQNLPLQYQRALKANHDVVNFPTVGVEGNYMFPQVQVNISPIGSESGGQ